VSQGNRQTERPTVEKDRSRRPERDTSWMGTSFDVIYRHGHRGCDHYLQMYSPRKELPGKLYIGYDGVEFTCVVTRTTQRFKLGWEDIRHARAEKKGLIFRKNWVVIDNSRYPAIGFVSEKAREISEYIADGIRHHNDEKAWEEQLEREQIAARELDSLPPTRFETLVAELFRAMGYQVSHRGGTADGGIDLVCKDWKQRDIIVQCKRFKGKVGVGIVRDLYGAMLDARAFQGYIVTTGEFTQPAHTWSSGKPIGLIGRHVLAELLDKYLPNGH